MFSLRREKFKAVTRKGYMNNRKCPICDNEQFEVIGKPQIPPEIRTLIKENYQVLKCKACHFYYVSPPITFSNAEWTKFYNEKYFGEMTIWWARRRERDRKNRLNRLETLAKRKITNFLDLGCGEGYVLLEAAKRGWKAYGVDISDNRGGFARREDISFIQGDIFQARFPSNSFDCVYVDSVLEHVANPIAFLNELNRIIKNGGVLYIGVPNEDALFNDVKKFFYFILGKRRITSRLKPFVSPFHINGFTKKSLLMAALKANFKVVRFRNFGGQYEFLKFRIFSGPFLINVLLLPIHLIAIMIRRQIYLEVILRKCDIFPSSVP